VRVAERLAQTVAELVREDPRRVLLGEDVADGGMLGLSREVVADPELRQRAIATPLVPASLAAHAGGLALGGLRPIVLLPSVLALLEASAGLREVALASWRTAGERTAPVLFVAPCGAGFGSGGDAGEGLEPMLARTSGLRVACIGRAEEAAAWLRAAAAFEGGEEPTVLLLPRSIAIAEIDAADERPELGRPLDQAARVCEGDRATVIAWGETVAVAEQAARASGFAVTVVDVGSLAPLPRAQVVLAARETGKVVIAHAGPRTGGLGGEIAAMLADEALLWLDAPILRVCGADGPLAAAQETAAVPSVEAVKDAIVQVVTY
jgi:pyruvate/2-oxoglutarate/acetoin dehydrogenase E1 component